MMVWKIELEKLSISWTWGNPVKRMGVAFLGLGEPKRPELRGLLGQHVHVNILYQLYKNMYRYGMWIRFLQMLSAWDPCFILLRNAPSNCCFQQGWQAPDAIDATQTLRERTLCTSSDLPLSGLYPQEMIALYLLLKAHSWQQVVRTLHNLLQVEAIQTQNRISTSHFIIFTHATILSYKLLGPWTSKPTSFTGSWWLWRPCPPNHLSRLELMKLSVKPAPIRTVEIFDEDYLHVLLKIQ